MIELRTLTRDPNEPQPNVAEASLSMDYAYHMDISDDIKVATNFLGLTREPDVYNMVLGDIALNRDMPRDLRPVLGGPFRRLEFETIKELGHSKVAALRLTLQSKFVDRHFYLASQGTTDEGYRQPFLGRPLNSQVDTTELSLGDVGYALSYLIPASPGKVSMKETSAPLSIFDALADPRRDFSFNDIAHNIGTLLLPHARTGEIVQQYLAGRPLTGPSQDRSQAALTVIEQPHEPLKYNLSLSAPYDIHGHHVSQHVLYSFVDDENMPDAKVRVRLVSHDLTKDDLRDYARRQSAHLDAADICHRALSYFRQPLEQSAA
jgi:hypothetical protein